MNRTTTSRIAHAGVAFALVIGLAPAALAQWTTETIESAGSVGLYTALGVGAPGQVYAAYYDAANADLRCAESDGVGGWTAVQVDGAAAAVGEFASIACDPGGLPHIMYYDRTNGDLRHAWKVAGVWDSDMVDGAGGNTGMYTATVISTYDMTLHVVYYDVDDADLKHAWAPRGGGWTIEVVDAIGERGRYASLAVGIDGTLHAAYYGDTQQNLIYAFKRPGFGWSTTIVDSPGNVGMMTSIAMDSSNRPMISYYDATNSALKLAIKDAGVWGVITVVAEGAVGQFSSIAGDDDGGIHITYYDATSVATGIAQDLRRTWLDPAVGAWQNEAIDTGGNVGRYSSLRIHPDGALLVAYYDLTNTAAKLAALAPADFAPPPPPAADADVMQAAPSDPADLDRNSSVDVHDLVRFNALLAAGDPAADIDANGCVEHADFLAFKAALWRRPAR